MNTFSNILRQFQGFSIENAIDTAVDRNGEYIVKLIQTQLQKGEDGTGKKLRTYKALNRNVYANYTIALKQAKGQDFNNVTLFDSGEFYKSMALNQQTNGTLIKENGEYTLIADFEKEDGNIADNLDVSNVLELQPENKNDAISKIKIDFENEIKKFIADLNG